MINLYNISCILVLANILSLLGKSFLYFQCRGVTLKQLETDVSYNFQIDSLSYRNNINSF